MEKQALLHKISELVKSGELTHEEINDAYNAGSSIKQAPSIFKSIGVSQILYYVGGAVIFIGIAILIGQSWREMSDVMHVIATFGLGIVAYMSGFFLSRGKSGALEGVSQAMYLICALILPFGLLVTFDVMGYSAESVGALSLVSAIMLLLYGGTYMVTKKVSFLAYTIIFSTWFYYMFTQLLIGGSSAFREDLFFIYRSVIAGLSYMLLGYAFSQSEKVVLSKYLYTFGVLGFLGSVMALGWVPSSSPFWQLVFPIVVFGVIFMSVKIRSSSFLAIGAMYLVAYIFTITGQYFSDNLGWPIALVLSGFLLMAIGYGYVFIKKRFLVEPSVNVKAS